jgi:hypothetical protein
LAEYTSPFEGVLNHPNGVVVMVQTPLSTKGGVAGVGRPPSHSLKGWLATPELTSGLEGGRPHPNKLWGWLTTPFRVRGVVSSPQPPFQKVRG